MNPYKLHDRLCAMDVPCEPIYSVVDPRSLLEALVQGSDSRGRYFANEGLIRRLFWWQETPKPKVAEWRDELVSVGEITIAPLARSSYSDSPVKVLTISRRQRFPRFADRPPIPNAVRSLVYARDGHACLHCGAKSQLSIDHIHPFSKGGGDEPDNLQTLCRPCNSRKGAKV